MISRAEAIHQARRIAALRELNTSPLWSRRPIGRLGTRPLALVWGNCQAEALRRALLTHPGFVRDFQLLRLPAVHEITPREYGLFRRLLPRTELLLTQEVKPDYRGMPLGSEQLIDLLPNSAQVVRYPVAFFEGMFPFHVNVRREDRPLTTPAPLSTYHDVRILWAASLGWDAGRLTQWWRDAQLRPAWLRRHAAASLDQLRRRETDLTVRLADVIAEPDHLTTGFHTINHPANALVVEGARQVLAHLGYPAAERVLGTASGYLEHTMAPREPQIVRALGGTVHPGEPQTWRTPDGEFDLAAVARAHLACYAREPELLAAGLRRHEQRIAELDDAVA